MVANESRSSDKSGAAARTQKASALCTYLWDAAKNSAGADPMAWKTSRRARGNAASTTQRDSNVMDRQRRNGNSPVGDRRPTPSKNKDKNKDVKSERGVGHNGPQYRRGQDAKHDCWDAGGNG